MKKYFMYELKKNIMTMGIITIFCSVIYLAFVLTSNLTIDVYGGIPRSLVATPIVLVVCLCTVVPMMMFSFKMQYRDVDCFYSMSITRTKLYLVKSAIGLIITLVPYTVSYWLGFVGTVIQYDFFAYEYFVALYFLSIPVIILLFGIIAFAFTRANHVADGVLIVLLYSCICTVIAAYFSSIASRADAVMHLDFSYWFIYSPITVLTAKYSALISHDPFKFDYVWLMHLVWGLLGIAAWIALIFTAKREKAENAGRVSDSWLGYRLLLPIYLAIALAMTYGISASSLLLAIICLIGVLSNYMIFRRSVKLAKTDLISIGVAVAASLVLCIFV